MRKLHLILLLLLANSFGLRAQQVLFVPNQGQWDGPFSHKMELKYGGLFFEKDGIQFVLQNAHQIDDLRGHHAHDAGMSEDGRIDYHALRMKFLGSKAAIPQGIEPVEFVHNYYLGEDKSRWKSGVRPSRALAYTSLYPSSELRFKQGGDHLKYEWYLGDPNTLHRIKWTYEGAENIEIDPEGHVVISTSVGEFIEGVPSAWGYKNGIREDLPIWYELDEGVLSFATSTQVDLLDSMVIDPLLVFTSFSGSLTDNWGFTATYDDIGRLYGGGVSFATGYVSTVGAFQTGYADPPGPNLGFNPDVTISVFEPSGQTLLYATYLGGTKPDHPHSMVVNSLGHLIVMGTTGSTNFPTQNPIQSSNAGGSNININGYTFENADIFVTRFNANGSALLSSTYLGGSDNDGINGDLSKNYGDASRGEVIVDDLNNIYLTASTTSTDFISTNCSSCSNAGGQDAVLMKLNPSGTSLLWSNYYGTSAQDAGFGIKYFNNQVFICGGTLGSNLPATSGAYKSTKAGSFEDGYVAKFNASTGSLLQSTYVGTNQYDMTFLLDVDKQGNVFVFGQTFGTYPISSGSWGTPQYRRQFIHKISNDLGTSMASTAFGSPQGTLNLVPTAFNVDDCLNILLSGWGGVTNNGFANTTVTDLPTTPDALQTSSNGSDFYFMVLGKNFTSFKYGSFFGGNSSSEHVDGGTSRFDDRGRIYQAVCAGCGGNSDLPTTPGAFSTTNNSSNCNLGVIKLDFETSVIAEAEVDLDYLIDTTCYELTLRLNNSSVNANAYFWNFDQGDTSNLENPVVTFPGLGTYNVMLVAIDTVCDTYDTTYVKIEHDTANFPTTDWSVDYTSCDLFREVTWIENLRDAQYYEWDFGDGSSLITTDSLVFHSYPTTGTFNAVVTARDSFCDISSQQSFNIVFDNNANVPQVSVFTDSCRYGGVDVIYANVDSTMSFTWDFSGTADTGMIPSFRYPESGLENITLTITDTVCNRDYSFNFLADIIRIEGRVYIPNAFTPNDDVKNELFKISGNSCLENPLFVIYDSWGNEVFRSENPFTEFWDGTFNGKPVPQDVYTYRFTGGDEVRMGTVTIFR